MCMLLTARMDTEVSNRSVSDGTMSKMVEEVVEQLESEAAYFTIQNGRRPCLMVSDMKESAQMPPLMEPLFRAGSKIVLRPVMNLDDLRAGLGGMERRPPGTGHARKRRKAGGTEAVSHTPLALTWNRWPARCMAPASTVRTAGVPRREPTRTAVSRSGDRWT